MTTTTKAPRKKKQSGGSKKFDPVTVFATLTPDEQEVIRRVRGFVVSNRQRDLREAYELGQEVRDTAARQSQFRPDFLKTMALFLNLEYSALLHHKLFCTAFTPDELDTLFTLEMKGTGQKLSWTHVRSVLHNLTPDERWQYLHLACDNNWTSKQLRNEINKHKLDKRGGRRGAGGHPIAIPPSVDGKLAQLHEVLPSLAKRVEAYLDDETGLLVSIRATPPRQAPAAWIERTQQAMEYIASVENHLATLRSQLEQAHEFLTAQQAGAAPKHSPTSSEHAGRRSLREELFSS